jgi:hypothetical protein
MKFLRANSPEWRQDNKPSALKSPMTDALLKMMRLDAGGAVQSGRCTFVHWVHFEGSGPDWRQIRESPAPGPANLREAIGIFCHNSANVHTYASTGDMLGIHSPEWRPKIKSSLGISPDTGDRKKKFPSPISPIRRQAQNLISSTGQGSCAGNSRTGKDLVGQGSCAGSSKTGKGGQNMP